MDGCSGVGGGVDGCGVEWVGGVVVWVGVIVWMWVVVGGEVVVWVGVIVWMGVVL